ncbi:S41 family peptidase [Sphingorhabdus lacus]|uniref:S41 family peptidase n=1 Tax=Sphingorhabdus lacus TaxID=392610 RepID=UPI0035935465
MLNRRHFLAQSAGTALTTAAAFPSAARAATTASAPSDIALVREIVTTLHPGLYRYNSPKTIDQALSKLERMWSDLPDLSSRYLHLSRFLATIKCGHSYANFFNQTKQVKANLFDRRTRLPFAFKWIGNQMVVTEDQSGTNNLPRGTVIKEVNGIDTKVMLARLLPYVRADGNNDAKRRALLSMTGADELETFDIFHGLIYGAPGSSEGEPKEGFHRLRMRLPNSASDVWVDLPALTLAERQAFYKAPNYRGDTPVWEWTMRPDGIAVLKMDGWALYNSTWKWEAWLNDRLDSLSGAKGLIVDIRENEGGIDCGDILLSRLAGKDIFKPRADRLVRYQKTPEHLNRYLDTWDDSFRNWGDQVEPLHDRFYKLKRWDDDGILAAKGPRVTTPMAVLTSAQNSSATFQFASLTKQLGLGTLVGEATGGNQRGINGGAFFFARLPESSIEFDVPLIGYFPQHQKPDAGLSPDLAVPLLAKDIADGADNQLDMAVLHLLRRA